MAVQASMPFQKYQSNPDIQYKDYSHREIYKYGFFENINEDMRSNKIAEDEISSLNYHKREIMKYGFFKEIVEHIEKDKEL